MKCINLFFSLLIVSLLCYACSSGSKEKADDQGSEGTTQPKAQVVTQDSDEMVGNDGELPVAFSEMTEELRRYYQIPFIREFYEYERGMEYAGPPELILPDSLADLSYGDLRLLRNEIFARNGYLFKDGFLRGYFNRFKWYMPIFDVDTFKVTFSEDEQKLVADILAEESRRKQALFVNRDGLRLYNADLVVNMKQFKSVSPEIVRDLGEKNFSIVNANRQMPFYVYDKNAYQYIPHYITTDLYLFILHKYFSRFLEKLDENYMRKALGELLNGVLGELSANPAYRQDSETRDWAETYIKTALYALTNEPQKVPDQYKEAYREEELQISSESGNPVFIPNKEVYYKELKPRGHYTKSGELKNYFKAFKWISLNGIDLSNDQELKGMVTLAFAIRNSPGIYQKYKEYTATIEKLAGQEDNISIRDIIQAIDDNQNYNEVLSDAGISRVKSTLGTLNKERVKRVFGKYFHIEESEKTRVYFLSGTYSISGEIFSKLVHVKWNLSKRPFPKGLDIPAVFRDKTAQHILLDEYQETVSWPAYSDSLTMLQNQFDHFDGWELSYGAKALKTALSVIAEKDEYPDFMKSDAYNRKELGTMLSSWTHIKHDLILYQEKPYAAEAGQGGGPEPPQHYSYVEPNVAFWEQALSLTEWLKDLGKFDDTYSDELQRIRDIGYGLLAATGKQLRNEKLTDDEMDELSWIGGKIEYILLGLLETDHLPEREKSMALIADVYAYQKDGNTTNLNVAVGHADDIYVLVPVNGEYHIARGSVFSYYEFQDSKIYNDEEWRKNVKSGNVPERPEWIAPLIHDIVSPEGQMEYRYAGY